MTTITEFWRRGLSWYRGLHAFVRICLIPTAITACIFGRIYLDAYFPAGVSYTMIVVLSALQSFLAYSETKTGDAVQNQAVTFREVTEAASRLVNRKAEHLSRALDHFPDNPNGLVRELARRIEFSENANALTEEVHRVFLNYVRRRQGYSGANLVTALISPNAEGGFDLISHQSSASSGNLEARVKNLKTSDQKSLACKMLTDDTANLKSASDTSILERKGEFLFFPGLHEEKFIKSIVAYKVSIDGEVKFIWTIDSDKTNSFPDSDNKEKDDVYHRINEIFVAFSDRIKYEYYISNASKIINNEKSI